MQHWFGENYSWTKRTQEGSQGYIAISSTVNNWSFVSGVLLEDNLLTIEIKPCHYTAPHFPVASNFTQSKSQSPYNSPQGPV